MEAMSLSHVKCIECCALKITGHKSLHPQIFLYGDICVLCAYEQILYSFSAVLSVTPLCEISGCILPYVFSSKDKLMGKMEQTRTENSG